MAFPDFKTLTLSQLDQNHIWHPFTQRQTARPPLPIVKGKGSYLYCEKGTPYLDGISSWWVNLHGHSHPYICEKIKSQIDVLEHVIFADFTHPPAINLASQLLPLLPGEMSKLFYSDNGSTAVEVALKIALQFWHNQKITRDKIICFQNSYHGDTFGAMSVAGKNELNKPFWKHLFEVIAIPPPLKNQTSHSLKQLKTILKNEKVACFIFEPLILGVGGMVMYPPEGLDALIQCCKKHEVLTIADEVMTGFGRTETLFACEQLKEKPDLICLSKGLTGGFLPLGATACAERIFNAFLADDLHHAFLHGHSYTANPLACTAALASLDLLLEEKCTAQRTMIASYHKKFCERWQLHPKLKRCESLGTILAIEYKTESSSYFQSLRHKLYPFFLEKRILLRPLGNVLYVMPPYCIRPHELTFIYDTIINTFEEIL